MTILGIKNNVQALLSATNYFVSVFPHPPDDGMEFAGFPAVTHYYADTESDFATVSQNKRVIEYIVELYLVTNSGTSPATEFTEAYQLIDDTIQMFDASIDLSSTSLGLARACDIMRPAPGALERIPTKEGEGLLMTIRLFCEADISFR